MIYSTGTISLNGNIATGNGSNWTAPSSQVRQGQVLIVLSTPVQLFQINTVNSATELTVSPAAAAPLSNQKYGILVSDAMSLDGLAQAMSQLINEYDENIGAWETFALTTAAQDITVTINGQSVTIPSLGKLKDSISKKADLVSGAVAISQGGTGATTSAGALANLGAVATNDSRLGTVNGKSGGVISSGVSVKSPGPTTAPPVNTETSSAIIETGFSSGVYAGVRTLFHSNVLQGTGSSAVIAIQTSANGPYTRYMFSQSGNATAPGSWIPTSDERIKDIDGPVEDPLAKMRLIRGQTWALKDGGYFGIGFTAQDVQNAFPKAVRVVGSKTLPDGSVVPNVLAPDTYGVASALHHEALLSLMDILKSALEVIADSTSDTETREKLSAIAALIPEAGTVQKDNAVENQ